MLFRRVIKPHGQQHKQSWETVVVCTTCGQSNTGSTYKSNSITNMSITTCTYCSENLGNQEHLNKKIAARLSYHKSK